ncbi:unnamed protein product [Adineta steineri]|uniref:(S)-2-hydroxy-acid oxidase n=1 Tax=Adineta steineri TaxID=433720 RepID=A0A818WL57_9BILA|nr:unnamed protein product [Adineta steineri]
MKNNQLYILLFGTTLTASILFILNSIRQKKKRKQIEEKKNEYLKCKSLNEFEELAKKLMKSHRFYYYDYKAGEGHTYKACRDYFDKKLRILPRVLIDVNEISLKTKIFGCSYESPIIIAPTTFHCLANIDGEIGTARGATEAQCIYTYNWMYSTKPEDEVLKTDGPKFLHIYLTTPKEILEKIVQEAEIKGYRAIVITCDHPTDRVRDNVLPLFEEASKTIDKELNQSMPMPNMNLPDIIVKQNLSTGSITWANIEWLRKLTKLPLICKGVLSPIDANLAIQHGANGIIVSNHGGRQVDTAPPAIECLEDIINVVDGRVEVFIDTGIRSGTDILKALALGARAILIGRPILYGLACGGHNGVKQVLDILKRELIYDMACCGLSSIDEINKNILYKHT